MGFFTAPSARRPRRPHGRLIIREDGSERVVELKARVTTVGRSHENDVTIDDINSSRKHCQIERNGPTYEIVDLKSRNGTLVNGILVLRKELRPGDVIEIGKTQMFFDHVSEDFGEETIDLTTDHFLEPLSGLETEDQLSVLKKEREIFLKLLEINRNLNSRIVLSDLLDLIIDTVVDVTGAERGFLLLAEGDASSSAVRLAQTGVLPAREEPLAPPPGRPAEAPPAPPRAPGGEAFQVKSARNMDRETVKEPEFKLSRAVASMVLETGRAVRSDDVARDRRLQAIGKGEAAAVKSVLCVPVRSGDRTIGAIYVDNRFEASAFTENHRRWLEIVADQAAVAIRNAQLFEGFRARSLELEEARSRLERLNLELENKVLLKSLQLEDVMKLIPSERPRAFKYDYSAIVTRSPRMYEIFKLLDKVTDSTVPVLILGESGTGKELIAKAIHQNGPRKDKAFVSENCAAIPVNLLESEFFGHVRGAFTGASRDKRGLFEVADGGTLFLDEIADMSPAMQTKFLRVLQEGEIRRVGGKDILKVDVRVISATNKNIYELVRRGEFREDLLYRINVITITLPPLRERREDIPLLIDHFLERIAARTGEKKKALDRETFHLLYQYDWPGNVRELENETERLAALSGDVIPANLLSPNILAKSQDRPAFQPGESLKEIVQRAVEDVERQMIRSTLMETGWKKTRAAEMLGISRPTLDAKIEKYGLARDAQENVSSEAARRAAGAEDK